MPEVRATLDAVRAENEALREALGTAEKALVFALSKEHGLPALWEASYDEDEGPACRLLEKLDKVLVRARRDAAAALKKCLGGLL